MRFRLFLSALLSFTSTFGTLSAAGRIGIVAHRGFWNCEEAGFSENSIASLKAAQENGL